MNPEALAALKESIEHWEENTRAESPSDAKTQYDDCALCSLYADNEDCEGCPVAEDRGESDCSGTPWYNAHSKHQKWLKVPEDKKSRDDFREAAQIEVDFLKSLLPESDHD